MTFLAQTAIDVSTPAELARVGHWAGCLNLTLAPGQHGKTVLKDKQQTGPYTVQRPLYPEPQPNAGICHLILLHPPGGLVEGDNLTLNIQCQSDSHALITTPSAGKVYQCRDSVAGQTQHFTVQAGATLEWFPQEMILFDQSLSSLQTQIHLEDDAQFAGWEITCLGRDIAEDYFQQGSVTQSIELWRNAKPVLLERLKIDASDSAMRTQAWGLADNSVFGTFIITGASASNIEQARRLVNEIPDPVCQVGVTLLKDVLVCRALSKQSRHIKAIFSQIWSALREEVLGVAAQDPRIWRT